MKYFASLLLVCALVLGTAGAAADEPEPLAPDKEGVAYQSQGSDPTPGIYWDKAMEWISREETRSGRLLLEDLGHQFPENEYGLKARRWLHDNRALDQAGRTRLIVSSTLDGAFLGYTLALGLAGQDGGIGSDEHKTALWTSLGCAGAGLLGSVMISWDKYVSDSQATFYSFAGLWGWYNGFFIYDLVSPLREEDALLAGAGGMILGIGTTLALWDRLDVDEGAAQMSTNLAMYVLELSAISTFAVGGWDVYHNNETAALLTLLLPANAAIFGGYYLGKELKWSASDIQLIGLGGILGNLAGATIIATVEPESGDDQAWKPMGILGGSTLVGLAAATLLVRPWDQSAERSRTGRINSLLTIDDSGLSLQPATPILYPTTYKGETGYVVEVPFLAIDI